MSEFRRIAIGLLGMSHPEIYRARGLFAGETIQPAPQGPGVKPVLIGEAVNAVRLAFAALVAGSRAIPLGDNGRLTRELGEYGARLKGC